jgi:hypothetical protein
MQNQLNMQFIRRMEYLNNLLINTILYIMNHIKSQISASVVHLSPGLAEIRTPGLDRHNRASRKRSKSNDHSTAMFCCVGNEGRERHVIRTVKAADNKADTFNANEHFTP